MRSFDLRDDEPGCRVLTQIPELLWSGHGTFFDRADGEERDTFEKYLAGLFSI